MAIYIPWFSNRGFLLCHPLLKGRHVFLADNDRFPDWRIDLQLDFTFWKGFNFFDGVDMNEIFPVCPIEHARINLFFQIRQ